MRRRQPAAPAGGELPAELVRFRLEDWTEEADAAGVEEAWRAHHGTAVTLEEMRAAFLRVRAHRRWTEAREVWAGERGLRPRDLPPTVGPAVDRP